MELTLRWLLEQPAVGLLGGYRQPGGDRTAGSAGVYDYIVLDAQHGLIDYRGRLVAMQAVDTASTAAGGTAALVRVIANDAALIGQALDAGASGVIVPRETSPSPPATPPSRPCW
jgi:4-hydroxy-2-oxoheptanedioate aldolase